MLKYLANLLKVLWDFLQSKPVPEVLPPVLDPDLQPIIHPMTNEEKFLKVCLDALDTDPTPKDEISDDVACAHTLSTLIKKVYPDFPILSSTKDLDAKLFLDKRFKRMDLPNKGRIIISPRTSAKYGHCGVWITNERIASNNSSNGLFQGNYTWESWIKEFKDKRGLKIYIYELIT